MASFPLRGIEAVCRNQPVNEATREYRLIRLLK
jgi:hypothetical protein